MRVTDCGEGEAGFHNACVVLPQPESCAKDSVDGVERNCEPMDRNRIEGVTEQGERAKFREALVIKAKWRKSGGCVEKECVLTRGDLASWLKG
ncbi:hypothetical protein [Azonexus sp.]|uniref:hypothetical protein n=1 Tax=Azonexus sp. TaxID=1872668 RepID=UPI0039E71579